MSAWSKVDDATGATLATKAALEQAGFPGVAPPYLLLVTREGSEGTTIAIATLQRAAEIVKSLLRRPNRLDLVTGKAESKDDLRRALRELLASDDHALH